ncbi:hypothetical protein SCOR_21105 [Sulfidibacter corallicola]|uniref:Uncharacterized protein n=1 Tax=Sulfidibacter corallicola TaxID=2818388 RepID=A0A8A4TVA9_SULCO|nr:hypothetical protein [Sulfidibacter corallicola]QTD53064.1 hypothetical protein J3U87_11435 [Sulfidibacter corallicola]
MTDQVATTTGGEVGQLFAKTIMDVKNAFDANHIDSKMVTTVDLEVTFNAVSLKKTGWKLLFTNNNSNQNNLNIRLATRINLDAGG